MISTEETCVLRRTKLFFPGCYTRPRFCLPSGFWMMCLECLQCHEAVCCPHTAWHGWGQCWENVWWRIWRGFLPSNRLRCRQIIFAKHFGQMRLLTFWLWTKGLWSFPQYFCLVSDICCLFNGICHNSSTQRSCDRVDPLELPATLWVCIPCSHQKIEIGRVLQYKFIWNLR